MTPAAPVLTPTAPPTKPSVHPAPNSCGPCNKSLAPPAIRLPRMGEPLFLADWDEVLMVHYEVDPTELAPLVPFPLDLREGRAYVSLVAFNLRGMRPYRGGRLGALLVRPIASHGFLNVRTYVTVDGEPGIYFLTEHLDNRLSLRLGPPLFGLPYQFARVDYRHDWLDGRIAGRVTDPADGAVFSYRGLVEPHPEGYRPVEPGSLTEWLMERYTAYTARGRHLRKFRVWHPPWPARPAVVRVTEDSLLRERWPWFARARRVGADFSPGVRGVWMSRPRRA